MREIAPPMHRILIWDLPTRLFHWLLAGGCVAAAVIALILGEDSRLFAYHSLIGLVLLPMIGLRVLWGLVGTRYARFRSFAFGPSALAAYAKGVLSGRGSRHVGHNPGSSYAIFAMLALVVASGVTGIMMGRGDERVEEAHEILAYALVGVIGAHLLGVVMHSRRVGENITASMIHGRKVAQPSDAIASARPIVAYCFLLAIGAWGAGLVRHFDPATGITTLPLFGSSLRLDEGGGNPDVEPGERGEEREDGER